MSLLPKHRECPMPAVQLSHGHQIQTGYQGAHPRREIERIHDRVVEINSETARDQTEQQRIVEYDSAATAARFARNQRGMVQRQDSRKSDRQDYDESGQWPS